jgi:hypothetical protein
MSEALASAGIEAQAPSRAQPDERVAQPDGPERMVEQPAEVQASSPVGLQPCLASSALAPDPVPLPAQDSCRYRVSAMCRCCPPAVDSVAPGRLPKAWEACRFLATAPGPALPLVVQVVSQPLSELPSDRDGPPNIPLRSTRRKGAEGRTQSPAAQPC